MHIMRSQIIDNESPLLRYMRRKLLVMLQAADNRKWQIDDEWLTWLESPRRINVGCG